MKVILLQDVARIGRRFQIKEVPDGHARNYLIPRRLAEPATPESEKRVLERAGKLAGAKEDAKENFAQVVLLLETTKVELIANANAEGHLFKGIKKEEIAEAISKAVGHIDAASVILDTPIKSLGEHVVALEHAGKKGNVTLMVIAK